jgi:hypothetical protein
MDVTTVFAIQYTANLVLDALVVIWFVIPWLSHKPIHEALTPFLFLHALRTLGLTYLAPGVSDPRLPPAFTGPTAYGDLIAAGLAFACLLALRFRRPTTSMAPAILLVWVFNVAGLLDLVNAIALGLQVEILNYQLGPMWFIPAFVVPALIVTHLAIFWMLWKYHRGEWR